MVHVRHNMICPHCGEEIEYVNSSFIEKWACRESVYLVIKDGEKNLSIANDDYEQDDFICSEGDAEYTCPECDETIEQDIKTLVSTKGEW